MTDATESTDEWACGYDDASRRALTLARELTPTQRLAWLEQVMRIALRSGALARSLEARAGRYGGPWDDSEAS